ncbi:hypothetical protein V5O48_016545 [Marasmius crinis-equi]|uniref:Uncharacterized protein n=1 Tax=Marasmius crinis-equi TaxID=585013 RepID=A0ABR3ERK1_9AGAR
MLVARGIQQKAVSGVHNPAQQRSTQQGGRPSPPFDMAFDSQQKQVEEFLRSTFEDGSRLKTFLNQKGHLAQHWLDRMQQLADHPSTPAQLRSSTFRTMLRLSKKSGLHPTCLSIHNVRKFGKFPIAEGGFGEVWRGFIGSSQDPVCLKIMKVYLDSDLVKLSKDYLREAILWRQLRHPNVLPFLGIYRLEDGHQVCLISPWMEDGNLVKFLKDAPPEDVDHFALARDIAAGLSYLHEMTIVHGDLKGVNVVVNKRFRACITDFGLSRVADEHGPNLTASTTRSAGTVRWRAPELLMGSNKVTKESDVYAFGCVCYEIYAGCHPFPELAHDGGVIVKVVVQKEHPSRPGEITNLSDVMWALMESCWSSAPPSRPTADALLRAMDVMEAGASVLPLPNWDQSVFTQVWENIEYSPPACEDKGMPENKIRSDQEPSLAHSATPGAEAYQQAIPNRSDANLELLPGQSNAPFTSGRGRKRKASNEGLPVTHSKRAVGAPEGFSAGWMPSNLDVDVDRADDTAHKWRLGSSSSTNTAFLDRQSHRDPQNPMSPLGFPNNMGGPGDFPGQSSANFNPSMNRNNMMLQALQRDQNNNRQLELMNLAQSQQNQNGPFNLGGLGHQGGGFNGGGSPEMSQPGGPSRGDRMPPGGAEAMRRPSPHPHPPNQPSQQPPQLGGAQPGPPFGNPQQAAQMAALMNSRGGRVITLPDLQDRQNAMKSALTQLEFQIRSLIAARSQMPDQVFAAKMRSFSSDLQQKRDGFTRITGLITNMTNNGTTHMTLPVSQPPGGPAVLGGQPWMGQTIPNNSLQPPFGPTGGPNNQPPQSQPNGQPSPSPAHAPAVSNGGAVRPGVQSPHNPNAGSPFPNPQSSPPNLPFNNMGAQNNPQAPQPGGAMSNNPAAANIGNNMMGHPQAPNGNSSPFPPLVKERFNITYKNWCNQKHVSHDQRLLSIDNLSIDLHTLHTEVMKEGGLGPVQQRDLWAVIAARMGWVQFPGGPNDPAKSGPDAANQLAYVYKEYLADFDRVYMSSVLENRRKQQAFQQLLPSQLRALSPQQMRMLVQVADIPAAELRAKGMPEDLVRVVETNREALQLMRQDQNMFKNMLHPAPEQQPGLPPFGPHSIAGGANIQPPLF